MKSCATTCGEIVVCLVAISALLAVQPQEAAGRERPDQAKRQYDQVHRDTRGIFDRQLNTRSNISLMMSNSGVIGRVLDTTATGGSWPRTAPNSYIYGAGLWIGGQKETPRGRRPVVFMTYNPNNGRSWAVPGRTEDGPTLAFSNFERHRVYFSTDYDSEGIPTFDDGIDSPWPIWDARSPDRSKGLLRRNKYFGTCIPDLMERSVSTHAAGPAYISDEDVYTHYKDTDVPRYGPPSDSLTQIGFPLGLQIEQTAYSSTSSFYEDIMLIRYKVIYQGDGSIDSCWIGHIVDPDINPAGFSTNGYTNDREVLAVNSNMRRLVAGWTNLNLGEQGKSMGYFGVCVIEGPATSNGVDALTSFRSFTLETDPQTDADRYNMMRANTFDENSVAADKRWLLSSGPFSLTTGDTVHLTVAYVFARPDNAVEASGADAELGTLKNKALAAQVAWDNDLRTFATSVNEGPRAPLSYENSSIISTNGNVSIFANGLRSIQVLDLAGATVHRQGREGGSSSGHGDFEQVQLDLHTLPGAVYLLVVTTNSGVFVKRLALIRP